MIIACKLISISVAIRIFYKVYKVFELTKNGWQKKSLVKFYSGTFEAFRYGRNKVYFERSLHRYIPLIFQCPGIDTFLNVWGYLIHKQISWDQSLRTNEFLWVITCKIWGNFSYYPINFKEYQGTRTLFWSPWISPIFFLFAAEELICNFCLWLKQFN